MTIIKKIFVDNEEVALIVDYNKLSDGVTFVSKEEEILQLGGIKWPKNKIIKPHRHNKIKRTIVGTSEVIFLIKGKLLVYFYDKNNNYSSEFVLCKNQAIILRNGAHGFKVLEACEFIEVKNGPYDEELDKIRIEGIL